MSCALSPPQVCWAYFLDCWAIDQFPTIDLLGPDFTCWDRQISYVYWLSLPVFQDGLLGCGCCTFYSYLEPQVRAECQMGSKRVQTTWKKDTIDPSTRTPLFKLLSWTNTVNARASMSNIYFLTIFIRGWPADIERPSRIEIILLWEDVVYAQGNDNFIYHTQGMNDQKYQGIYNDGWNTYRYFPILSGKFYPLCLFAQMEWKILKSNSYLAIWRGVKYFPMKPRAAWNYGEGCMWSETTSYLLSFKKNQKT